MYYQFLVEDQSGGQLVELLMQKVKAKFPETSYSVKSFKGIGGFTKKNTVKETKDGKLLNDLSTYLRGFNKALAGMPSVVIVVLDNDQNDPAVFYQKLCEVSEQNQIQIDHAFCLAIEETEAWLLGDEHAIRSAYPKANLGALHEYRQDSICGTWEVLANVVYKGGLAAMKKLSWAEQGREKFVWASMIGPFMTLKGNKSPSFQAFIQEILSRAA
ncbi:MAG: hypothetical protein IJK24_07265 [Oscillospiraceae bacterium]|nr:hypothetical protein [Oscillospiraceae bacterium]